MPTCQHCGKQFPNRIKVKEKTWHLTSRKFCPECSKLGGNNRRQYVVDIEDGRALCARCGEQKLIDEFHKRGNGLPLSYCKSCQETAKKSKFSEKMDTVVAMWGGACADCQQTFPTQIFQFCQDTKVFSTSKAKNMSIERLIQVLAGHEMLCLNCLAIRKWQKG